MVIIDTSVWIPALRNRASTERTDVAKLVETGEAAIVGMVMTELLRGARNQAAFEELNDQLQAASYVGDEKESWALAAQLLVDLKLRGETIPLPDAVIAAQALLGEHAVFTHDEHFQRIPGLKLYSGSSGGTAN